jgi:NTP pyrophosphatase (non-canonical NTP hydrolase)
MDKVLIEIEKEKESHKQIKDLIKRCHGTAVEKGFYECPKCEGAGEIFTENNSYLRCPVCGGNGENPNKNTGELLMLIVSELGEALEAHRKWRFANWNWAEVNFKDGFVTGIKDTFEDEIADVFIRLFDMCGYLDVDIEKHIYAKMKFNSTRKKRHGKRY